MEEALSKTGWSVWWLWPYNHSRDRFLVKLISWSHRPRKGVATQSPSQGMWRASDWGLEGKNQCFCLEFFFFKHWFMCTKFLTWSFILSTLWGRVCYFHIHFVDRVIFLRHKEVSNKAGKWQSQSLKLGSPASEPLATERLCYVTFCCQKKEEEPAKKMERERSLANRKNLCQWAIGLLAQSAIPGWRSVRGNLTDKRMQGIATKVKL